MRLGLTVFILLFIVSLQSYSQKLEFKPKIEFFSYPFTGFKSEEITDIQVDKEGYVWVISFSTILKYDGSSFESVNTNKVNHGSFLRFHETDDGRKFVVDFDGTIFFIRNLEIFPDSNNHLLNELNPKNSLLDVLYKEDKILVSYASTGSFEIKDKEVNQLFSTVSNSGRIVHGCVIMDDESVFLATQESTELKYTSDTSSYFFIYDHNLNVIDSLKYNWEGLGSVPQCVRLPNKNYLFSDGDNNLIEFNSAGLVSKTKYDDWIIRLFVDKQGNLWVSTIDNGIGFYPNSKLEDSNKIDFMKGEFAFVSTQDYLGGLWFYSHSEGLGYLKNEEVKYLQNINPSTENTIELDRNDFYIGSIESIYKYNLINNDLISRKDADELQLFIEGMPEYINYIFDIKYNKYFNSLWLTARRHLKFLSNDSLNQIDVTSKKNYSLSTRLNFSDDFYRDSIVIVYSDRNIALLLKDSVLSISQDFNATISDVGVYEDKLWVSKSDGLFLYNLKSYELQEEPFKIDGKKIKSSITIDDLTLFAFNGKGLYQFNGESIQEIKFNEHSLVDGYLVRQNNSALWLFNRDASFKINLDENKNCEIDIFKPIISNDVDEIKANSKDLFLNFPNGEIVTISFKKLEGLLVEDPKLIIDRVVTADSIYLNVPNNAFNLDYSYRSLTVDFTVLNYHNNKVEYEYQLEGSDTNWISINSNSIVFKSLNPDNYSLKIRSRFKLGGWTYSKPIQFAVNKAFWQQWWFILLSVVVVTFIIYLILRYRYKKIQQAQGNRIYSLQLEQKVLRSQMNPHFIFNIFASLQYLIVEGTKEKALRFVELFSKSIRNLLDQSNMNDISIQEEIRFLKEYIELEQFRMEYSFDYTIECEPRNIKASIPVFMVQPFVENAIKHGLIAGTGNNMLQILFRETKKYVEVTVLDNGIGRQASNPLNRDKRSHGVRLVEQRLRIHNNSQQNVIIEDLKDNEGKPKGTKVKIKIIKE